MKTYTSFKQSKKLAEILLLQSADMHYERVYFEGKQSDWFVRLGKPIKSDDIVPCWSLATLLNVLPEPNLLENNGWHLFCDNKDHFSSSNGYNNPVDACVEMIVKLKENDLL